MYEYSYLTALDHKDLDRSQWTKPKTTRRNLQPPKAERLINLWVDGKILFRRVYDGSDEIDKKNGHEFWEREVGVGLWMLYGENAERFDFRKAQHVTSADGVPVHGLKFQLDSAAVEMEAFCDTERKCSCFVKVAVTNNTNQASTQIFSFLLRTDKMYKLAGAADHYLPYNPKVEVWKTECPSTWKQDGTVLTDGKHFLTVRGEYLPVWESETGVLEWKIALAAGVLETECGNCENGTPYGDANAAACDMLRGKGLLFPQTGRFAMYRIPWRYYVGL